MYIGIVLHLHVEAIDRICHKCLIGACPTSGTFTYLENWPPKFFVQNREVLLVLFYGSFEYSRTSVLGCTLNSQNRTESGAYAYTVPIVIYIHGGPSKLRAPLSISNS